MSSPIKKKNLDGSFCKSQDNNIFVFLCYLHMATIVRSWSWEIIYGSGIFRVRQLKHLVTWVGERSWLWLIKRGTLSVGMWWDYALHWKRTLTLDLLNCRGENYGPPVLPRIPPFQEFFTQNLNWSSSHYLFTSASHSLHSHSLVKKFTQKLSADEDHELRLKPPEKTRTSILS